MTTCPWCGTNYEAFQSNCDNCGGSLPTPTGASFEIGKEHLLAPPPPPRDVPRNYALRALVADGWAMAGGILALVGAIFAMTGVGLTLGIITAFVGLPFLAIGVLMFGAGTGAVVWRYQEAQTAAAILQEGEVVLGEIVEVYQNLFVQINGRHPWTVRYRYVVEGQGFEGKMTTLMRPDLRQQPGKVAYVVYAAGAPHRSMIYPYPYGYHSV